MADRRVVITGLGAVTGLGLGAAAMWDGLLAGRSGVGPLTRVSPEAFPCGVGAEVRDFSAKDHVPKGYRKAVKVMARDTELAVAAARLAVADAGLTTRSHNESDAPDFATTYPQPRLGCQIGAGLIAAETLELTQALATARTGGAAVPGRITPDGFDMQAWGAAEGGGGGMNNLQPLWMLKYLPNMLACHVTIIHGAEGPSNTITCGEVSGLLSLGESLRVIQRGAADLCFSGGAESKINLMGMLRQTLAGRLADTRAAGGVAGGAAAPSARPFDPESLGTVPGEAGAIVIVEELAGAKARNANIYGEVVGFGAAQSTPTLPGQPRADAGKPNDGLALAIRAALTDAGIGPDEIDAIVPQGLGVPELDKPEAAALREVFGARLASVPLVLLTPSLGDCWAGYGGVQVVAAAMMVRSQMVPARLEAGKPAAGLLAAAAPATPARLGHVLACSSSLGGQNAAVIVRKIE